MQKCNDDDAIMPAKSHFFSRQQNSFSPLSRTLYILLTHMNTHSASNTNADANADVHSGSNPDTERDNALLAARPTIEAVQVAALDPPAADGSATSLHASDLHTSHLHTFHLHTFHLHTFHHRTLRPVLKLQNAVLLDLCAAYCTERRSSFLQQSRAQQQAFVGAALKRDAALRNQVLGIVVGVFSREERHDYLAHRTELAKRILELAAKRVADQMEQLVRTVEASRSSDAL
jgi:hypothetical protein